MSGMMFESHQVTREALSGAFLDNLRYVKSSNGCWEESEDFQRACAAALTIVQKRRDLFSSGQYAIDITDGNRIQLTGKLLSENYTRYPLCRLIEGARRIVGNQEPTQFAIIQGLVIEFDPKTTHLEFIEQVLSRLPKPS